MVQVWHFVDSGAAQTVPPEEAGRFYSDKAYVVLAAPADGGEGQQRLFLWAGADAPQDTKSTAAKHASELMQTLDASYLRQQQSHEALEFKQLFASFSVVDMAPAPEVAADPSTEAVPPQVGGGSGTAAASAGPAAGAIAGDEAVLSGGDEEEGEEGAAHEDGGAAGGGAAAAAGKKKKKRGGKKKGHGGQGHGDSQQQESAAAAEPAPAAVASPRAKAASPTPSPAAKSAEPAHHTELHADAKPFMPSSPPPAKPAASPKASPPPAKPAASPKASPPAATPAAAAASTSPVAAAAAASPAAAEASSPAPAAEATPPKTASPKLSVDETVSSESVAKAKQQLLSKLSGSLNDPLGEKQQRRESSSDGAANGRKSSYAGDAAKAWGGTASAAPPPAAPPAAEAKVKPGEKTFSYEELKALRADSGIDMTSKEAYLTDADFEKVFGKDRADFKAQPAWRQQLQKKEVGLW